MQVLLRRYCFSIGTLVCWIVAGSLAVAVGAQTNTGEIEGVVKDPLGLPLPGAAVSLLHAPSGLRLDRTSDENGRFFVAALPVGEYVVTVSHDGARSPNRA